MEEQRSPTKNEIRCWWLWATKRLIIANVEKIRNQERLSEILFYVQNDKRRK
jgi:hypothetical protein